MLFHIILKNFRSNLKNYVLFFTSSIIAIAELFVFWGMNDIVKKAVNDEVTAEALKFDFQVAAGLMVFITVFLMIYAMQHYVRLRIKDYSMFVILGMKKRSSFFLLLLEYCTGCATSLAAGLAAGQLLLYGTQWVLKRLDSEFLTVTAVCPEIYRNVCILGLALMAVVFIGLMVWMEERDLSGLAMEGERVEKRPAGKGWILPALAGAGLTAFALYYYQSSDKGYVWSHVFWIAGLFLLVYFGLALILGALRKRKHFYLRNILKLNQLYSHYQNSLLVLLMLLVLHFFALTYLTVETASVLPLDRYRENYPYDAVWLAREEDQELTEQIKEISDCEIRTCPMVRMTTRYGAEHIGISAGSYERLGGKQVHLEGREILVGIEDQDFTEETRIEDESYQNAYFFLYTGREKDRGTGIIDIRDPEYLYDIQEIITESVIGQYSIDRWHENLIVMSGEEFERQQKLVKEDTREATVLTLFDFQDGNGEKAMELLKSSGKGQALYHTEDFLHGQEMRLLFSLVSKLLLLAALFASGFFITGIRILTELDSYRRRYTFLNCMGMKKKEQCRLIRFETGMLSRVALGSCLVMAVLYLGIFLYRLKKEAALLHREFWWYWLGIIVAYILADMLIQRLFANYILKRLGKGGKHHACTGSRESGPELSEVRPEKER